MFYYQPLFNYEANYILSFSVLKLAVCHRSSGNGLDWMWVKM